MKRSSFYTVTLLIILGILTVFGSFRAEEGSQTAQYSEEYSEAEKNVQTDKITDVINFIGEENAKERIKERGGSEPSEMFIELDEENGVWKYKIKFRMNGKDYRAEVNAITGEIMFMDSV